MDDVTRIALLLDTDAVSGALELDGHEQPFDGWLELMALVEDVRKRAVTPSRARDGAHEGRR